MSSATMTMIGLYNYDSTLFDGLTLPAGIDKQITVDEILTRSGEFEVLYSDPNFMKLMIEHWGKKHYRTFEKWIEALNLEFDPLYNYDRYEEYTDDKIAQGQSKSNLNSVDNKFDTMESSSSQSGSITNNEIGSESSSDTSSTDTINNAVTSGDNHSTEDSTTKDKGHSVSQTSTDSSSSETDNRNVAAYDSATMTPREEEIKGNTSGQTGNGTASNDNESVKTGVASENTNNVTQSSIDTQTSADHTNNMMNKSESQTDNSGSASGSTSSGSSSSSEQHNTNSNTEQIKHTAHLYGNIGVTTSSELLASYLDVERFNIYEQIADIFVDEFCIMIY